MFAIAGEIWWKRRGSTDIKFSRPPMMQASSGYSAGESATAKCSNSQALALHVGGIVTFRSFLNKFLKKIKSSQVFPLKYFFHFMLVDNSPIHSIFTLNNGIQKIFTILKWNTSEAAWYGPETWKAFWNFWNGNGKKKKKKKPGRIKMHFIFKNFSKNRLPETTFHKLAFGFNWSV